MRRVFLRLKCALGLHRYGWVRQARSLRIEDGFDYRGILCCYCNRYRRAEEMFP